MGLETPALVDGEVDCNQPRHAQRVGSVRMREVKTPFSTPNLTPCKKLQILANPRRRCAEMAPERFGEVAVTGESEIQSDLDQIDVTIM